MAKVHEVVTLPSYHCELNPIELACSQVKHQYKENNEPFTLSAVNDYLQAKLFLYSEDCPSVLSSL